MSQIQGISVSLLGILFHVLIIISIILGFIFILKLVHESKSQGEKTIRSLAVIGGFFLFYLTKVTGVTISELLFQSISQYSVYFKIMNITVPAIIGFLIAIYCIQSLKKKRDNLAMRVIILFGILLISQFIDVYIFAAKESGLSYSDKLLPNISFTLAIILYVVFRYQPKDTAD